MGFPSALIVAFQKLILYQLRYNVICIFTQYITLFLVILFNSFSKQYIIHEYSLSVIFSTATKRHTVHCSWCTRLQVYWGSPMILMDWYKEQLCSAVSTAVILICVDSIWSLSNTQLCFLYQSDIDRHEVQCSYCERVQEAVHHTFVQNCALVQYRTKSFMQSHDDTGHFNHQGKVIQTIKPAVKVIERHCLPFFWVQESMRMKIYARPDLMWLFNYFRSPKIEYVLLSAIVHTFISVTLVIFDLSYSTIIEPIYKFTMLCLF